MKMIHQRGIGADLLSDSLRDDMAFSLPGVRLWRTRSRMLGVSGMICRVRQGGPYGVFLGSILLLLASAAAFRPASV